MVIFRACAHQTSAMAATVRLATRLDVPLINALVYELAEVEEMRSSCKSTDIGLNELLFTHAPFQGPTVFILEIEEPTKEAASQNKHDEAMSGTVVTKPLSDTSGEIEKVPPVNTSEVLLGNTASVELMLFRSVSNVKYRGRFFSEACSPKASDGVFLNEVSSPKSLLQSNKETDMEEPVLEVFRSASNMNLKEHDTSAPAIAASEVVEAPRGIPRINSGSEDLYAEVIGEFSAGSLVEDPDREAFQSPCVDGKNSRIVAGFAHVFPNYSTYLAKPGLYMEALHIRKPYRRMGLGTMFLKKIAKEAVKLGMERIEWCLLHSNQPAINFYEGNGGRIKPGFRKCAIDGEAFNSCEP